MKKSVITIVYDNEEMFSSVQHILHCLDCEAFQVTTEENGVYEPLHHEMSEPKPVLEKGTKTNQEYLMKSVQPEYPCEELQHTKPDTITPPKKIEELPEHLWVEGNNMDKILNTINQLVRAYNDNL